MTTAGWLQIALFALVLTALTPVLGAYLQRVFTGERIVLERILGPPERAAYRLMRVDPRTEQGWKAYARSALVFSLVCFVALYVLLRTQGVHPGAGAIEGSGTADLSFNTAASFVSNTSWQFYGAETTLTTASQVLGIAVHSFLSAAVGLAAGIAVLRGFTSRSSSEGLGNFWVDLTRGLLYVLLPIAVLAALALTADGVVQSFGAPVTTAGGQVLSVGPVASQVVIKTMGSVGGGYFNVNSAMPFENAGPFGNLLQALLIVLVPAALTSTYGRMAGNRRAGWLLYGVMLGLLLAGTVVIGLAEAGTTPAQAAAGLGGANMEGKEVRFGIGGTALYAAATTAGASGAVNAAMESLSGLGASIPFANMLTGEVIFGGIGSGIAGMLLLVALATFLGGLMVGRSPELLGKPLGAREIKLIALSALALPVIVLGLTAVASATDYGRAALFSAGRPQGFSELLYGYGSQGANNGSAFAGYTGFVQPDGTNAGAYGITFADLTGGLAMLLGRYVPLLLTLAVAGGLASARVRAAGPGTLRSDNGTFAVLLLGTTVVVVLLNFLPALLLGPIAQGLTKRLF